MKRNIGFFEVIFDLQLDRDETDGSKAKNKITYSHSPKSSYRVSVERFLVQKAFILTEASGHKRSLVNNNNIVQGSLLL